MDNYTYSDELQHWGIKGMKWGVRRYQNKDGSLTPAGRKRYSDNYETVDAPPKKKSVSEMSDSELRERINRLNMEKQYKDLTTEDIKKGKSFISKTIKIGTSVAAATTTSITVYNNIAKTRNAFTKNDTKWPIIGQGKDKK